MKEKYFSLENIGQQAQGFLDSFYLPQHRRHFSFLPQRSVLLVLDMQRYFLEESSHAFIPSAPAIFPNVKSLIQAYHAHELPVMFTRHLNTAQNAGQMAVWWRDMISADNSLSEISPDLDSSKGEVLVKCQYDAFYRTSLEDHLRAKGVTQVVICGVMTHLCCETTARSAFMRGFQVFFTVDGTATYNKDHHRATLVNLSHGFAVPVLVKDLVSAMGDNREGC